MLSNYQKFLKDANLNLSFNDIGGNLKSLESAIEFKGRCFHVRLLQGAEQPYVMIEVFHSCAHLSLSEQQFHHLCNLANENLIISPIKIYYKSTASVVLAQCLLPSGNLEKMEFFQHFDANLETLLNFLSELEKLEEASRNELNFFTDGVCKKDVCLN